MWIEQIIGVGSHYCHHLKNHNVILVHVFQNIFSSLEDVVESSLFEDLEEDIFQGLKWKQEGKPIAYIVQMGGLIYILSINLP
jgi:hypothetical protein